MYLAVRWSLLDIYYLLNNCLLFNNYFICLGSRNIYLFVLCTALDLKHLELLSFIIWCTLFHFKIHFCINILFIANDVTSKKILLRHFVYVVPFYLLHLWQWFSNTLVMNPYTFILLHCIWLFSLQLSGINYLYEE